MRGTMVRTQTFRIPRKTKTPCRDQTLRPLADAASSHQPQPRQQISPSPEGLKPKELTNRTKPMTTDQLDAMTAEERNTLASECRVLDRKMKPRTYGVLMALILSPGLLKDTRERQSRKTGYCRNTVQTAVSQLVHMGILSRPYGQNCPELSLSITALRQQLDELQERENQRIPIERDRPIFNAANWRPWKRPRRRRGSAAHRLKRQTTTTRAVQKRTKRAQVA